MLRCFGDVGENLPLKPSLTRSPKIVIKMSRVTLKDHLQAHRIFVNMMIKKRRLMMTLSPSCSTRSSWILSMKPLLGFLQSIIRVRQNLHRNLTLHHPGSDYPQFPQKYYLQSWPPHVQWHGPRLPTFADFTLNYFYVLLNPQYLMML